MSIVPVSGLPDAAPGRLGGLLRAELTKIRTLPATWVALIIALVADTVLGVLASTDAVRVAGGDGVVAIGQLGTVMLAPVYVFIASAVFAAGSEFSGGQVRVSLLAAPDRNRLLTAKVMVTAAVSTLGALLTVLPGYLVQHAAGVVEGDLAASTALAGLCALVAVYLLLGLVGYGIAMIARSVVVPLAGLFVAAILVAPMLRGAFPDVVRYLPHDAALSLLGTAGDPSALGRLSGLLVLTAWACGSVATAWVVFARRDS